MTSHRGSIRLATFRRTVVGATGARVWQWSLGKLFTSVVSADAMPPKGKLVFTQQWSPAAKGTYTAVGSLVSQSHDAVSKVQFTVR